MTESIDTLKRTAILNAGIGDSSLSTQTLEYLFWDRAGSGDIGGGGVGVNPNHIFTGADKASAEAARDAYFAANPDEKQENTAVLLTPTDGTGPFLQLWNGTTWGDGTAAIRGPKGEKGDTGPQGPAGAPGEDGVGIASSDGSLDVTIASKAILATPHGEVDGTYLSLGIKEDTRIGSGDYVSVETSPGRPVVINTDVAVKSRGNMPGNVSVDGAVKFGGGPTLDNNSATTLAINNDQVITDSQLSTIRGQIAALEAGQTPDVTGTIGVNDNPMNMAEGDYYVTEKFVGAPTIAGDYVGLMQIRDDFDGNDNGKLLMYYTDESVFYKLKFAGGWEDFWQRLPAEKYIERRLTIAGGTAGQVLTKKTGDNYDLEWKDVATEGNPITHVSLVGDTFTFTYADGSTTDVELPNPAVPAPPAPAPSAPTGLRTEIDQIETTLRSQGVEVDRIKQEVGKYDHQLQSLPTGFVYHGPISPIFTGVQKSSYFCIFDRSLPGTLNVNMPGYIPVEGTVFYAVNHNTDTTVKLNIYPGTAISGKSEYDIPPHNFVMLVIDDNANWRIAASGYIPMSQDDMVNRVVSQLQKEGKLAPAVQPAPALLAYVPHRTSVTGGRLEARNLAAYDEIVYPSEVQVGKHGVIVPKPDIKAYNLSKWTGNTKGRYAIVALFASFEDIAPVPGSVVIYATSTGDDGVDKSWLYDVEGEIVGTAREFKQGQPLYDPQNPIVHIAIVDVGEVENIRFHIEHSFDGGIEVSDPGDFPTGIMIQGMDEGTTGDARQQFELDTEINFRLSKLSLGDDFYQSYFFGGETVAEKSVPAGEQVLFPGGVVMNAVSKLKYRSAQPYLVVESDGEDLELNMNKVFSSEYTRSLRGETVDFDFLVANRGQNYDISLVAWTGDPDRYDRVIVESGAYLTGWTEIASVEVNSNEAPLGTEVFRVSGEIPSDANNFAILVETAEGASPTSTFFNGLKVSAVPPTTRWYINDVAPVSDIHLKTADEYKTLVIDNRGYAKTRYTINDTPQQPMPCGIPDDGKVPITINPNVNVIDGDEGEGAIVFQAEGSATISTEMRMYSELPPGQAGRVTAQWNLVDSQGNLTPIEDSVTEMAPVLGGQSIGRVSQMRPFTIQFQPGTTIALTVQGSAPNCAYLESDSPSRPLLKVKIDAKFPVEAKDIILPKGCITRALYVTTDANDAKQTLAADSTPETVIFNNLDVEGTCATIDGATGVITLLTNEPSLASMSVQVLREGSGAASVWWAIFAETSADGNVWTPLAGSTRYISLSSQEVSELRTVSYTLPIRATDGAMYRFRHATNDASKQVSIISKGAVGSIPSASGVVFGLYTLD